MSWEPIDPKKPSDTELLGDEPFDIIAEALDQVIQCYQKDLQRKPTTVELVKTFERVLAPRFSEAVMEGETTELTALSFKTKRIPKRQKYQAGDFLKAKLADRQSVYARIFEIGRCGTFVGVYDSRGLKPENLEELRKLPLIVKVTQIHSELLKERAWVVIGNLPLNARDKRQPRGPLGISGANLQLNAANYYYKLPHEKWYDLDEWVIR